MKRKRLWVLPVLTGVLLALMACSLTIGRYDVSLSDTVRILTTSYLPLDYGDVPRVVVEIVRLPRVLLVVLCGMALSMSGAAMQGVFRNPLVGPEVCGVSSGAAFGGVVAILLGWPGYALVLSAFVFGLGALALAFLLARCSGGGGTLALILAGVVVGAFFSAAVGMAQYVADPQSKLPAIVYWLLGSFATASFDKVILVACSAGIGGVLLYGLRWRINLLSLGEADASALGVPVALLRWSVVSLTAVLVAAQVSVSGGIGWVGLVIPHFARTLVGPDHARVLPTSALMGGLYLLAMDDIARTACEQEIPIGLLTAMVGTPIFAALFWKRNTRGWRHD